MLIILKNAPGEEITLSGKEVIACAAVPSNRPSITLDAFKYILEKGITPHSTYQTKPAKKMDCNRSQDDPVHYIKAYVTVRARTGLN